MSESTPLTCSQCYKYFPNSLALSRHMHIHQQHIRTHTEHKSHSLVPRYNMDLSQLSSLMSQSSLYQKHKPYRCENCSECFADEAGLLEHIPKHKENKHICQYCGKNLYNSSALSNHIRIHLGIKPFNCYICKRTFTQRCNLHRHMRIHLGIKSFPCDICKRTFTQRCHLQRHMRIHLEIKPFQCEICQSKFTQLVSLQRHKRTHTGEKPYKCPAPGCNRAFSDKRSLVFHSCRYHQKNKPYKCNTCRKCFADEADLLQHIPNHKDSNRINIHICQFCGKSYQPETCLANHMNKKHADRLVKRPLSVNLPSDKKWLGRSDDSYGKSSYVHLTSPPTHYIHPHVSEPYLSTRLQHVDPRGTHELQNEQQGPLPEPVRRCEPSTNQQESVHSTPADRFDGRMMLRLPQTASQEHQPDGLRSDQAELPIPYAALNLHAHLYEEGPYHIKAQERSTVDPTPLLPDFV